MSKYQTESNMTMCCAQFYEQDIVQQLLGDSFHPGGPELSQRLVRRMNLPVGSLVLDVACGVGTTSHMMANEFGFTVTGLDYSDVNVGKANQMANAKQRPAEVLAGGSPIASGCCGGVAEANAKCCSDSGSVTFQQGTAADLPFEDDFFDGVVCECAVSTFGDQQKVVTEFLRVLKPGGILGITDMVVDGELPQEVADNIAPWTCMAKAHTVLGYQQLFLQGGFFVVHYADESNTLLELVSELKRKLVMAGMGKAWGSLPGLDLDISQMRDLLGQATKLTRQGTVQYCLMIMSNGRPLQTFCDPVSSGTEKC